MSEENVERMRRGLEAFGRGDLRTALEHVHVQVRAHRIAPLPDPKAYRGLAGVLMAWEDWIAPFDGFEMTVGELIDAGHSVVAQVRLQGPLKDGGAPAEEEPWFVWTFFEGQVVQWDMVASKRQALKGIERRDKAADASGDGQDGSVEERS